MKPNVWLFSAAMSVSCLALAQKTAPQSQVTEITDPAKIAEIERHAQELAARPPAEQAHKQSTRDSKKKSKAKPKPAKKDKPPSDAPMAPETKG